MHGDLVEILTQFDVISFDIFDTLLLRPFLKPTDLFWKMERDEGVKGFAKDRIDGERRARVKAGEEGRIEVTLDEIYAEIPKWTAMKKKEYAAERKCLVANPEVVATWNVAKELGKKVIITSDMYLPASFIQKVLRENGIDGWDGFYLSSERKKCKWSGDLYDVLLSDLGCPKDKILHIGDNNYSDVGKANEKGIVAYGYQKVMDNFFEECPFVKSFLGTCPSLDKRLFVGAIAIGWHLYKCEHRDWTYWNRIGFLFAGTLGYAYMKFVGENAKKQGFDHIMFVARDGYILQKIFNVLYPDIKTDYFYASRSQALFSSKYFGRTEAEKRYRRRYCLKCLETNYNVNLTGEQKEEYESVGELPIEVQHILDTVALEKKAEARKYLSTYSIDSKRTAIVDGNSSHFTVQRFVSDVVGQDIFTFYLFVYGQGKVLLPENALAMAVADWGMRYYQFSEFLFGAPTPPLEDIINGEVSLKKSVLFFERFKMQVSSELAEAAASCADVLNKHMVKFTHDMWLDWNDAFMDNLRTNDKEMFSLARNSTAIGHEAAYQSVLVPPENPRRRLLFGRTLTLAKTYRRGCVRYRMLLLLGKFPIVTMKYSSFMKIRNVWIKIRNIMHRSS